MSLELPRMLVLPTQSCIVLGRISPRDKVKDRDYTDDSNKLSVVFNMQFYSKNVRDITSFNCHLNLMRQITLSTPVSQ